ncbi:MAG: fumarate reductase/succinate dehydrogenase flavoprotein subunit [Flavobacteriales bacterium]
MSDKLNSKIPEGPIQDKWSNYKAHTRLVNPSNRRKVDVIIIGTGLAGGAAAATLGEAGYNVKLFCFQDSPRRAHSIAAQGGINASRNYQNDNDSDYRLFYDTVKGGDYRGREANVYRLAQLSGDIIDQCVAQGVPFAREYGGTLANRSFGGAQVQRTFYASGATGQQLLLGAYGSLSRQIARGTVTMYNRHEMLELVLIDGQARGIIARNLITGEIERHGAHAVVLGSGGYGNVFYLSTNAMASNTTAAWKAYKHGAFFANPCFTQIHPTCIPVSGDYQSKLTLMSESLRNDGRIWVPKDKEVVEKIKRKEISPEDVAEEGRDYYLERRYPAFGNLVPRDVASRAAKERCDAGFGVNSTGYAVYLDFSDAITRLGEDTIRDRYGNLFDMYERITGDNPYKTPMMIYPASHYTMGGLWVDYELMTTVPGLYAIGEANFSDHGANRLGASSLMQCLSDGYFVLPATISNYLADDIHTGPVDTGHSEFEKAEKSATDRINQFLSIQGKRSVDDFHKALGKVVWDKCGMGRNGAGLKQAISEIKQIRDEFWKDLKVPGTANEFNVELEKAGRVADFLELAELLATDALHREESCGAHFREEHQTEEGEAKRNDEEYAYVAAWEYKGEGNAPELNKEHLSFEAIEMKQRNYK